MGEPDDQLDAVLGHRLDEEAAGVDIEPTRFGEESHRGSADRLVPGEAEPDQAEVALVGEAGCIDLEDHRVAAQRPRRLDGSVRVADGDGRRDGHAGVSEELRGCLARQGAGRSAVPASRRRRPARRPSGRAPVPANPRATGLRSAEHLVAQSHRATEPIAWKASRAPRRSGAPPPCSSRTAFVSGGGSPDVNET